MEKNNSFVDFAQLLWYVRVERRSMPMERLVGKRFKTLDELKEEIEKITQKKVNSIIESESDRLEGTDFMIDYEFDLFDIHTMFYLKDNANNYYITEV